VKPLPEGLRRHINVDPVSGCWLWQAYRDRDGYGKVTWKGKPQSAHRVAYEVCVGPIPSDLVLDHVVCDTPPCIRPDHVKPTTQYENTMRGCSPPAINARKTKCVHGHPFDDRNTYRWQRRRNCRTCNRIAARKLKRKAARSAGSS